MPVTSIQLESLQQFAAARILNGGGVFELEDLLEEWKFRVAGSETLQDDVLAVKASLDDLRNGQTGIPAEDAVRQLKLRFDGSTHQ
jgi:hypothetical protein